MKMIKYSKILSLALLALGLSSCLKDDMIDDQKYGMINLNAKKIVQIPTSSNSYFSSTVAVVVENADISKKVFSVVLASEEVASEDIVVTLSRARSAEILANYNTEKESSIPALTGNFSIPSTVTIPKGSRSVDVPISYNPKDLSGSAAFGVDIQSVDKPGYTIAGNYGKVLVILTPKSPLDGYYNYKTSATTSLVPNANDDDVRLRTVSATRVSTNLLNTYSNTMVYEINPVTNKVTVISGLGTPITDPSSHWDPVSKVMFVKWTAGSRSFEETFTRTGESE